MGSIEQARRPTAEVNRIHKRSFDSSRSNSDGFIEFTMIGYFALNSLGVGRVFFRRNNSRMEIAVGAFRLAERHLYVDSEVHVPKNEFNMRRAVRP